MAHEVIVANKTEDTIVCYAPTMITTNGVWQGDNPLDYSLPLFILQLTLIVVSTRVLVFLLKPFRQPRVISEILVRLFVYLFIIYLIFNIAFFILRLIFI
jgi:hypothetical protein